MNTGFLRPAVATVLTVYGIETTCITLSITSSIASLQQYLPFTVLKPYGTDADIFNSVKLQQYLPFTVLKLSPPPSISHSKPKVATVLTVYGIETQIKRKRNL